MNTNIFIDRYRQESTILGRGSTGPIPSSFPRKDVNALKGLLLERIGSETEAGKYFYSQGNLWKTCILQDLKEQLENVEKQWERHVQNRVNIGEKPPSEYPRNLQEQRDKLQAQRHVTEQEIEVLEDLLAEAETKKRDRERKVVPPQHWGAGNLRNGVLVSFCGWDVSKNPGGALAIDDSASPFNGMEIWRLKSQIVNPLHAENRLRQREEVDAAESEGRKRKNVAFPEVPSYDRESDQIEYPASWHSQTITKIRHGD